MTFTLIKIILGELNADKGKIKRGVNLDVAYFDQHRQALDLNSSVIDAVGDGKRDLLVNGQPKHVISYLQDYLFTPDRVNAPVSSLSGGEKNRLLLAKLMLKPSNFLILDEPTNDLDVETLELLEDILANYQGTLILVSHDREFVDNVVTTSVYFEGQGKLKDFVGGYTDIENWYEAEKNVVIEETSVKSPSPKSQPVQRKTKKLSYKHQLELDKLPILIEELEDKVSVLQKKISEPEFFKQTTEQSNKTLEKLAESEKLLAQAYDRWDELEALAN